LAHVRASLQMYVETPSDMPPDTLKKYLFILIFERELALGRHIE
jgi:hypothetical protein